MNKKLTMKNLFTLKNLNRKGRLPTILKTLKTINEEKIEKLVTFAENEFKQRPRLKKIVVVAYKKHPTSLGRGCQAICIYRDGSVTIEHIQGEYGCIITL